jgi:hypothetical protein
MAATVAVGVGIYDGARVNGRKEGSGTYKFPSGTVYSGAFADGEFHGEGTLEFANGGRYRATWERGKVVAGRYDFSDGLGFQDQDWEYCTGTDRRFFSEHVNGLRPAGDAQVTNAHPPPRLPKDAYDVGDGYLDAATDKVYSFAHVLLRNATCEEKEWVAARCRVGK